jgi:hypothetical protein
MDLGDVFDLLLTPSDWIENWTSWVKFLLIVAGIGVIVAGATGGLAPAPAWIGYVAGPIMILGSVFWIIRDRMD